MAAIKNIYIDEPDNCTRIKIIGMSSDKEVLIDTDEKNKLERYDWTIQKDMGKFYAVPFNFKYGDDSNRMANKVLEIRPSGRMNIKYKNENTLDNRKKNLIVESKGLIYNEGGQVFLLDLRMGLDDDGCTWIIQISVRGNKYNYTVDAKQYNIEEAYTRAIKKVRFQ